MNSNFLTPNICKTSECFRTSISSCRIDRNMIWASNDSWIPSLINAPKQSNCEQFHLFPCGSRSQIRWIQQSLVISLIWHYSMVQWILKQIWTVDVTASYDLLICFRDEYVYECTSNQLTYVQRRKVCAWLHAAPVQLHHGHGV